MLRIVVPPAEKVVPQDPRGSYACVTARCFLSNRWNVDLELQRNVCLRLRRQTDMGKELLFEHQFPAPLVRLLELAFF